MRGATDSTPSYNLHSRFSRFTNNLFGAFASSSSSHRRSSPAPSDRDWIPYNGPFEPPAAWAGPPPAQLDRPLPPMSPSTAMYSHPRSLFTPDIPHTTEAGSSFNLSVSASKRPRSSSRSKVLSALGLSPAGSPRLLAKSAPPHQTSQQQPTFLSLDAGLAGGIGESPQPVIRERERDRSHHPFTQHLHLTHVTAATASPSRRGSEPAVSSTSPPPHHPHHPMTAPSISSVVIGGATGARTSLLGFGNQPVSHHQFHNPRKAPLPPPLFTDRLPHPYAPYANSHPSNTNTAPPESPEARQFPTPVTPTPLTRPRGNSSAQPPHPDDTFLQSKPSLRKRAATHSADTSPTIPLPPVPPPATSPEKDRHPYALVSAITPTRYRSPSVSRTVPQYVVTPPPSSSGPNTGSGSGSGFKPPIPPKSAATVRVIQRNKTLKGFSSTPNLQERARAQTHAIQRGQTELGVLMEYRNEKGKERERPTHVNLPAVTTVALRSAPLGYPSTPPGTGNRLQAQTICDAFMFPKPRFVAHVISPPTSPGTTEPPRQLVGPITIAVHDPPETELPHHIPSPPPSPLSLEKAVQDGLTRERERAEWAERASKGLPPTVNLSSTLGRSTSSRLRSRTLSGQKSTRSSHKRGPSDGEAGATGSSTGTGARIGKKGSVGKSLRMKRSLDFLMAAAAASTSGLGDSSGSGVEGRPRGATVGAGGSFKRGHRVMMSGDTGAGTMNTRLTNFTGGTAHTNQTQNTHQTQTTHQTQNSYNTQNTANTNTSGVVRTIGKGKGKAGKLTLSLTESSGGTHSRKSSAGSRAAAGPPRPGSASGMLSGGGGGTRSAADPSSSRHGHSHSHSRTGSALSGGWAIRKVRSFCVSHDLSPADESRSFTDEKRRVGDASRERERERGEEGVAEGEKSPSLIGDMIFIGAMDDGGGASGGGGGGGGGARYVDVETDEVVDRNGRTHSRHAFRQLSMYDEEPEEESQLDEKQRDNNTNNDADRSRDTYPDISADYRHNSLVPPTDPRVMTPSPAPSDSAYTGVGIALGTPSMSHPYAQLPEPDEYPVSVSTTAGPHLIMPTPTAGGSLASSTSGPLSPIVVGLSRGTTVPNDVVLRHRLPPVAARPHTAPHSYIPVQIPPWPAPAPTPAPAPAKPATPFTPPRSQHPFAAGGVSSAKPFKSPGAWGNNNNRQSVNSVEAFFGAEMLEASHSVSPLVVREAEGGWMMMMDAEGETNRDGERGPEHESQAASKKVVVHRESDDSGMGSSTEVHMLRSAAAAAAAVMANMKSNFPAHSHEHDGQTSTAPIPPETPHRRRPPPPTVAPTMSSGSLIMESPPPSIFPTVRRKRVSSVFDDATTFGGRRDEGEPSFIVQSPTTRSIQDFLLSPSGPSAPIPTPSTPIRNISPAVTPGGLEPIASSSNSSPGDVSQNPVASSSDDSEAQFKDLFYVPRAEPPTPTSPSPHDRHIRDSLAPTESGTADDDTYSDLQFEAATDDETAVIQEARRFSVISAGGEGWMPSGRIMSPLSSLTSPPIEVQEPSPSSEHDARESFGYFSTAGERVSSAVYDIPEEPESGRSSLALGGDENFRLGSVDAQQPSMTDSQARHHSAQLSLIGSEHGELGDLPAPIPRPYFRVSPATSDAAIRASYLTSASGTSARMSHIISDFPSPPQDLQVSFLEYYGVSPMREAPNPLSFTRSTSSSSVPSLAPQPARSTDRANA